MDDDTAERLRESATASDVPELVEDLDTLRAVAAMLWELERWSA